MMSISCSRLCPNHRSGTTCSASAAIACAKNPRTGPAYEHQLQSPVLSCIRLTEAGRSIMSISCNLLCPKSKIRPASFGEVQQPPLHDGTTRWANFWLAVLRFTTHPLRPLTLKAPYYNSSDMLADISSIREYTGML